jgi:tRNA(fMet)-specific endonuclease VapC
MIVLDTNHLRELQQRGSNGTRLRDRILAANQDAATTIISVEEMIRGWMAEINTARKAQDKVPYYRKLDLLLESLTDWFILPFDMAAATKYDELRQAGLRRIGTQDLMIAAIVLNHDALLLSANLQDFRQVPGLRVEDWVH